MIAADRGKPPPLRIGNDIVSCTFVRWKAGDQPKRSQGLVQGGSRLRRVFYPLMPPKDSKMLSSASTCRLVGCGN